MQARPIVYTLEQIQSADILGGWVDTLIGDGNGLQVVLGATGTVISNLVVTPTIGPSLTLNISNGFIASLNTVDQSAYGSLTANTTQVLQLGGNLVTSVLIDNAGLSAGQAQYILIQAGYIELDSDPVVLPYVNISNPSSPFYGPSNSGIAQDTVRNAVCDIQVKYGTPATAGSEVPPSPDANYVTVAYIDLAHGQVAITGGEILNPNLVAGGTDSPVLAGLLNSHHHGIAGEAPQVDLTSEVRNLLPMANLFASNIIGAVTAFRTGSGNPNGVLAGNANHNGVCDSYYDVTNNAFYMCTTTGSSSSAVWTSTNLPASHQFNLKVFTTSGSYTPSVGTKYISVAVTGAGGSGQGTVPGSAAGSGGGGGGTALSILPTTGLTFPATITIGTGAAGNSGQGAGNNGTNSQFATSEIGTNLTGYAGEGSYGLTYSPQPGVNGGAGGGSWQSAPVMGTITVNSVAYPFINLFGSPGACGDGGSGGNGGASMFGGGGISGSGQNGPASPIPGGFGGGGAGYNNLDATHTGSNGQNGVCVVIEFVGN
jgi:hypothetical protein